jgi:hypothetical protein
MQENKRRSRGTGKQPEMDAQHLHATKKTLDEKFGA